METLLQVFVMRIFDLGLALVCLGGLMVAFASSLPALCRGLLAAGLAIQLGTIAIGWIAQYRLLSMVNDGAAIDELFLGGAAAMQGLLDSVALGLLVGAAVVGRKREN